MNYWELAWQACNRQHAQQRIGELAAALQVADTFLTGGTGKVAEIGAGAGGTLFCWQALGADCWAVTEPVPGPEFVIRHGAELLFADSHTAAARDWLAGQLGTARLDVLFIDGDHTREGCLADVADYTPLVRSGGIVLVHDVLHTEEVPGVVKAWAELCETWPGAEVLPGWNYDDPAGHPAGFGMITIP